MNYKSLSKVLRYGLKEEEDSFKNAIYTTPHDATNHLVYADWLDEHNRPIEADFRRKLAKWHLEGGLKVDQHEHPFKVNWKKTYDSPDSTPEGVNINDMYFRYADYPEAGTVTPMRVWNKHREESEFPSFEEREAPTYHAAINGEPAVGRWKTYKDMEDAFYKAFLVNHNRPIGRK